MFRASAPPVGQPFAPIRPRFEVPASAWLVLVAIAVLAEARNSALQSWVLWRYVERLSFEVRPGPSPAIDFPHTGPFNEARGYTRLRDFQDRLSARGYQVAAQARFSRELLWLAGLGVTPPFEEPARAGLVIRGADGALLHDAASRGFAFDRFEEIPAVVVKGLLFIENRELAAPASPRTNPAVEWDRFARATVLYAGGRLGLPLPLEGASTLATQLEKYRHTAAGRTGSPADKLRQIAAASLRAYRRGTDTRPQRRAIVLDYVNSVPLSAAPGWGEVHGLGDGLWAWFGKDLRDVTRTLAGGPGVERDTALKQVLALLCAARAPSQYLVEDRAALEARVDLYSRLLAAEGVLEADAPRRLARVPLRFVDRAPVVASLDPRRWKAVNTVRNELMDTLGVRDYHELDALHLEAESTLDVELQDRVASLLRRLHDPRFLDEHGLRQDRLLLRGDPSRVVYSVLLFERTPAGNLLRVQADTLDQPLDLNQGMKLELGSTAKLRTLAHYLEVMSRLHQELSGLERSALAGTQRRFRDPLTRWAAETLSHEPRLDRDGFLARAMERRYSASPGTFFTGGGKHVFANFDADDNARILSVRQATWKSTNLVFIRLMRDLVLYHQARLPYDAFGLLEDTKHRQRRPLLEPFAAVEGDWIFRTRNRNAQDRRLKTRIERDVFAIMVRDWRRLGFPFPRLVPSLATAIGSSSDRPEALAELIGIVLNDGVRQPTRRVRRLWFAAGTPYHTVVEARQGRGERVMDPAVAQALRLVLAEVVEQGTARRVAGAFRDPEGESVVVGGKTGSGDNRLEKVSRSGYVLSSLARNRTATFVFYAGDRYFGVITAFVPGAASQSYAFTSALPVTVLRMMAPALASRLDSAA